MRSAVSFTIPTSIPIWSIEKRLDTLDVYAGQEGLPVIREEGYPLEEFLRQVAFREEDRCRHCYRLRLAQTAQIAKRGGFDAFTTTLLYSRFQKHDLIRSIGEERGRGAGDSLSLPGFPRRLVGRGPDFERDRNVPAALLRLHLQRKGAVLPHPRRVKRAKPVCTCEHTPDGNDFSGSEPGTGVCRFQHSSRDHTAITSHAAEKRHPEKMSLFLVG